MALGDLLSASIEAGGATMLLKFEGLGVAGTYNFNMGSNNDPTNANMTVNYTGESYTDAILGTSLFSVKGNPDRNLGAVRKVHPNEANPDETADVADVIIRVALADNIYDDDTLVTIDLASGFYTEGGNPSNEVTGFSVTNNSTLDYARTIANWLEVQKDIKTGNFNLEFFAVHRSSIDGKPMSSVVFTVTDESANSVVVTETQLKISSRPDVNTVSCYIATIDTSSFNDGDLLTCKVVAYPWHGDVNSILDTNDAVNSFPTPLYTNMTFRYYGSGQFGYARVDGVGGGSPSVQSTRGLAEVADAYVDVPTALTALQAYHNSNYSRNHAGGGYVLCEDGTYIVNTTNGGVLTEYVIITKTTIATKSSVNIVPGAANASVPTYCKFSGVTVTTGTNYWRGSASAEFIWFNSCTMAKAGTTLTYWDFTYGASTFCDGDQSNGFNVFSTSSANWGQIRGFNGTVVQETSRGHTVVGCKNVITATRTNSGIPLNDNGIYAFNSISDVAYTNECLEIAGKGGSSGEDIVHGFAIIQNIFERVGSQTVPLIYISGDNTVTNTNNIIMWYNVLAGARINAGYNDTIPVSGPFPQNNWSIKNNIISNYNNKDDTFGDNALATGALAVGYGVGFNSNHKRTSANDEWFGESGGLNFSKGTNAVPAEPGYIDDGSADGGNDGVSDYHLADSEALETASKDLVWKFDLEGKARVLNGSIGVYENISLSISGGSEKNRINLGMGLSL